MSGSPSPDHSGPDHSRADLSLVLTSVAPTQWAPSFFGVIPDRSIRRRPSDVVQLFVAVVLIAACAVITDVFTGVGTELFSDVAGLTSWIGTFGSWVFVATTVGAVATVLVALLVTRNFRLSITLVAVGAVGAGACVALAGWLDVDAVREALGSDADSLSETGVVWLSITTAVLLTVAPYLVRPARRSVLAVELLAVLGAGVAAVAPLAMILAAVGVGWAVSELASLVLGTPRATPTLRAVAGALDGLGIAVSDLAVADGQVWGETRFTGRTPDGQAATVVVIGRDAADARLVHKVWRSVLYRDAGPSISITRSAQLEHRAYLLLMAEKASVPVSDVVIAATAGADETAVVVLVDPPGRAYDAVPVEELTDEVLDGVWATVARLHAARLSHGLLCPANLVLQPDGSTALLDFSIGSAGAPSDRCDADRVDLLVTTAVLVGDDRALSAAQRSLGTAGLGELLPMIQSAALPGATRRAVPDSKKRLKTLREAGAELTGHEAPKLTELRRVSIGSVLMAAATFLGFYLIVNQFAGVDLWATLQDAEMAWVALAFVVSFVPQFSGSIALMGTVGKPLPFRPVLGEQFANNFTGLIGGTVATTALVIRFFQKQGLKIAVAASSGVMNAIAGSIVQITLVAVGLLVTGSQFVPSSAGGGDLEQIIIIGIVVIGVAVTIVLLVPKLRAALKARVEPQVVAARENLKSILSNPRKALMIFGGNLCSQIAFALVIAAALRAYDTSLPLLQIIVINSLATLVGGMAPVPGGMGVVEAGLIAGMTAAGVPQTTAVAATFTARTCTSYLSPIWGWFALRWLRRHDYV